MTTFLAILILSQVLAFRGEKDLNSGSHFLKRHGPKYMEVTKASLLAKLTWLSETSPEPLATTSTQTIKMLFRKYWRAISETM
jgi:hypothetical protein